MKRHAAVAGIVLAALLTGILMVGCGAAMSEALASMEEHPIANDEPRGCQKGRRYTAEATVLTVSDRRSTNLFGENHRYLEVDWLSWPACMALPKTLDYQYMNTPESIFMLEAGDTLVFDCEVEGPNTCINCDGYRIGDMMCFAENPL